jgi:hypothetical protein
MKEMKGFFNQPWRFSFKDILAIAFSSIFLFVCILACFGKDNALSVLQTLVPVIGIVLGGYFLQEGAAMYFLRSQGYSTSGYNSYSSYDGYNTYGTNYNTQVVTPTVVDTTTGETNTGGLSGEI